MTGKRVLITGATGNLGAKLRRRLAGRHDLRLLDRDPRGDATVRAADLSVADDWVEAFQGVDAVVHLAGDPRADQTWPNLVGPNIDATLLVVEAALRCGVRRFVFASSNHVMGGYKDVPGVTITTDLPPLPGTRYVTAGVAKDSAAYAATKLFGERVCRHAAGPAEFVAVRLGWAWSGDNTPAGLPADREDWYRQMWLSDGDFCRLMECCLTAELPRPFVVVNGMSANAGMRWDIEATRRLIGYEPQDDVTRTSG